MMAGYRLDIGHWLEKLEIGCELIFSDSLNLVPPPLENSRILRKFGFPPLKSSPPLLIFFVTSPPSEKNPQKSIPPPQSRGGGHYGNLAVVRT